MEATILSQNEFARIFKGEPLEMNKNIILQSINENTNLIFCAEYDDDTDIDEHFGVECGFSRQALTGLKTRLRNGSLTHFTAKVFIEIDGEEEGSAYLGSCFYKDLSGFIKGGYLPQMIEEAVKEAKIIH